MPLETSTPTPILAPAPAPALVGRGEPRHYRCVGIGVGPANLSLASLLHNKAGLSNLFLEKRDTFGWHDGQQTPDAALQVSMLKDLVSLADPTNAYSFLAYLHSQGRIYQFLNARFDAVPRQEFRNYLAWAAHTNHNIRFGEETHHIDFNDTTHRFHIHTNHHHYTADNISIGVGNTAWTPPAAQPFLTDPHVFHVSEHTTKSHNLTGLRVAIIGGGQSGAEAFLDLINRPTHQLPRRITWISRRANFFPIDDTPFTNDYYMPDHSDYFASLTPATRQTFNTTHLLTSDGISEHTLKAIYQRIYTHHYIHHNTDLTALYPNRDLTTITKNTATSTHTGNGYTLTLTHNHHPEHTEHLELDALILATGFKPHPMTFLKPLHHRLHTTPEGEYHIDNHYAAHWNGPENNNIYLQNATRQQRGLADPNLSLLAWRSQRILDKLTNTHTTPQQPSFIEWTTKQPSATDPLAESE